MAFLTGFPYPIIAIDFDGTIKSGDWRDMSAPLMPDCAETLKQLYDMGCKLVLWTCRTDQGFIDAINYLIRNDLFYYFDQLCANANCVKFSTSNKIYADIYVDDHNVGGFCGWKEVLAYVEKRMLETRSN